MSAMVGPVTVVLLGHTGVGKSATGNTILGQNAFESKRSLKSVTTKIKEVSGRVFGRQLSVVDTPGILGAEEDIRSYCHSLQRSCLFLVLVKVDRFTDENQRAVEVALRVIGKQRHNKAFLIFSSGDALDTTLDDFINEDDESSLPNLVKQFRHRYMAFNNRSGGPQQVRELLEASGHLDVVSGDLEQRRVVLLGMCGAGKSSSGNNLLGRESFRSCSGFEAVTAGCERHSAVVEGRELVVLDTPGLGDPNVPNQSVAESIHREVQLTGPEIHAFVIVMKIDRITKEECLVLNSLPTLFRGEAARYTMLLFTHGDKLQGQSIDHLITKCRFVSELVAMCAGRYCVFDNNQRRDRTQVRHFLHIVDEIVAANRGEPCRTAELGRGRLPHRSESNAIRSMSVEEPPEERLSLIQRIIRFFMELFQKISSLFSSEGPSSVPYQRLAQY